MTIEDTENFIAQHDAVLVYFFSDSCSPCVSLRPKVTELLQSDFPRMEFLLVDAAKNPQTAAGYHAFSLPVLIIYFEGKEYRRFSKYVSISELRDSIRRVYEMYFEN